MLVIKVGFGGLDYELWNHVLRLVVAERVVYSSISCAVLLFLNWLQIYCFQLDNISHFEKLIFFLFHFLDGKVQQRWRI